MIIGCIELFAYCHHFGGISLESTNSQHSISTTYFLLLMPIPLSGTWHACLPTPAHMLKTNTEDIGYMTNVYLGHVCSLNELNHCEKYSAAKIVSLIKSVWAWYPICTAVSLLLVVPPPPSPPPPLPIWGRGANFRPQSLLPFFELRLPHLVQRNLLLLRGFEEDDDDLTNNKSGF